MTDYESCPTCHRPFSETDIPPEPPNGSWVKDKYGSATQRRGDGWAPPGYMPFAKWEAMWAARGPLVPCGPWGAPLTEADPR